MKRAQHLNSSSVAALVSGTKATVCTNGVYTRRLTLEWISGSPHPGGYAGVRFGEALHPGPDDYERHHARTTRAADPHPRSSREVKIQSRVECATCNSWNVRIHKPQYLLMTITSPFRIKKPPPLTFTTFDFHVRASRREAHPLMDRAVPDLEDR